MAEKDIVEFASLVGITESGKIERFVNEVNLYTQGHVLTPTFRLLRDWGCNSYDTNRIHLYPGRARGRRYKTSLTQGTLIAAHGGQYIRGLIDIVKKFNPEFNLKYFSQGFNLKRPLYIPDTEKEIEGDSLKWGLTDPSLEDGELSFLLSGLNGKDKMIVSPIGEKDKLPNTFFKGVLGEDVSKYLHPFLGKEGSKGILVEKKYDIIEEEKKEFYTLVGVEPREEVSFMQVASFAASALLEYSCRENGHPEGIYASQNFVFHNQPKEGEFETMIKFASEPVVDKRGNTTYFFKTIVMQDERLVLSGDIVSQVLKLG